MVSIILVSYNLGEVTSACVESIKRSVRIPYEIIVVDNKSNEETIALLESIDGINLIKSNVNLGFPAGCNRGLSAAKGELIWFLNNDTIVPPGSLERMVELLLGDERVGIVGPVTNRIDGKQQIAVDYDDVSGIDAFAEKVAKEYAGQTWRVIRAVGFSMLMRKSSLDRLGGFDERMGIGTFEDDDLSLRFVADGYRLLVARDAFIHHFGNASFKAAGGYPPGGQKNQHTASCSAGMTVPDETVINERVTALVGEDALKVLHVECGAGAYGLLAEENGKYAQALESSAQKAKIAQNHYRKLDLYVPGEDFQFDGDAFDTAIIEKQYDGACALSLIRSILPSFRSGAHVILQVPKITAIDGCVYEAYMERWNADGSVPLRGRFDAVAFQKAMGDMGLMLTRFELTDARRGFFNRNSFARHLESAQKRQGALDFFKEALYVFEYTR